MLAYFRTGGASSGPVEAVNGEIEQVDRLAALDPLRQAVHRLGGAVADLGLVPGRDRLAPGPQGAAQLADLGWAGGVAHVGRQLVDPLERELGVAVGVELPDGLLPVTRPSACR